MAASPNGAVLPPHELHVSRAGRAALALAYAAVTFFAFPQPVAGRVFDLGLVMGWLAPGLLLLSVRGLPPRRAALVGFGASLVAHTALIHWIYVVTVVYGSAPVVVGLVAPALLACYCALFGGLFAASHALLSRARLGSPLGLAAVWTALDHLRHWEFPWGVVGYVQHENALLLPWAALGGVYALSFATAAGGIALAQLVAGAPRQRRGAILALAVVAALHVAGPLLGGRAAPSADAAVPRVRVAVLQGNIDQGVKWSRDWADRTLRIYESLTRQAAAEGARLIVWPETAVPGTLELDPGLLRRLERLAVEADATLVVGSVGLEVVGERPSAYFDSAFAFTPEGDRIPRYDKTKLVPFGEYVPFRPLIGIFVSSVASGATSLDVSAGERPRAMTLPLPDARGMDAETGAIPAGVVICYELLFPDLVRRFAADGAALLLAITNDAWYGRTGAPYQFLAMTALRSAETGLWTARAANTGVSGFIDGRGRVREATPIFEPAFRVADVPLHPGPAGATFYTRHGDVFARLCWAASALLLGAAGWRVRRARG